MCDYVIYAMFVAIGATVWLLWEVCEALYNKVKCNRMRKSLRSVVNDDDLEFLDTKDVKSLRTIYDKYFYKGKLIYE